MTTLTPDDYPVGDAPLKKFEQEDKTMRYLSAHLTEGEYDELLRSIYQRRERVLRQGTPPAKKDPHCPVGLGDGGPDALAHLDNLAKKAEERQLKYTNTEVDR